MTGPIPFPDAETVVMDLIGTWIGDIAPVAYVATTIPDATDVAEGIRQGAAYIRVQRVGGNAINRVVDGAVIEVACLTSTRAESWRILRALHARLSGWYGDVQHRDGAASTVTGITETKAPTQYPELKPDERRVKSTFMVKTRRPRR